MSYEEIILYVKGNTKKTTGKKITKDIAVEFNITGEGEGAFYIAVKNGKVVVEPYEYYDRDAKIITTTDELVNIIKNGKKPEDSFTDGNLAIEGNINVAREIMEVFKTAKKQSVTKKTVNVEKQIVEKTKSKNSKIANDIKK